MTLDLDKLEALALDCGDSSCRFAKSRRGMRTNGGCTCFDRPNCRLAMIAVIDALPALLQAARERDEAVRLLRWWNDGSSIDNVAEHAEEVAAFLARVSR